MGQFHPMVHIFKSETRLPEFLMAKHVNSTHGVGNVGPGLDYIHVPLGPYS